MCSKERAVQKVKECLLRVKDNTFSEARKRLQLFSQEQESHDIFAADIIYHKRCCASFVKQLK